MKQHPEREALGRFVREVWVEWAKDQPNPKPSWLVPWEQLSESDKEVDRRIGERLFTLGTDRLAQWEHLFETTNPVQASAEHATVLTKRDTLARENQRLLDENRRLTEGSRSIKRAHESLQAELAAAHLKLSDLKEARTNPPSVSQ